MGSKKIMAHTNARPIANPPSNDVEEKIMRLFALSDDALSEEAEREAYISDLGLEFLRTTDKCATSDYSTLAERFKASRIPDTPSEPMGYINYLAEHVIPHSINTSSPRFIGHMTTALPHIMRSLGKLVTTLNQNQVKMETSKSLSFCERQALAMMHGMLYGLPEEFYQQHAQDPDSTLGM